MKTIRSEVLGFCSGVSRAMESALSALGSNGPSQKPKKIYSLGPLIHNQIALEALQEKGLLILNESQIDCLDEDCVVIVRAHGISPLVMERIKARGAAVIDATCPRVALSQRRAAEFSQKGMFVILAGDAGHAEVKAVEGSAQASAGAAGAQKDGRFLLVQNADEAAALDILPQMENNAVLLSQTTFSPGVFKKISDILQNKICGLKVFNTICPATGQRQKALVELAKKVDAIVVVGGKKSANSQRLFELAQSLCKKAFFVESADDLPADFAGAELVGITAGASSPDFVIDAVESRLRAM